MLNSYYFNSVLPVNFMADVFSPPCQPSLRSAQQRALEQGLARLDAQLLLLHVLQRPDSDRAWLIAHDELRLTSAQAEQYRALSARRAQGEPLAYLVGHKAFFGLDLSVDARVLVPRPDTETLVSWALDAAATYCAATPLAVLDLGTGSGAIALALAAGLSHSHPLARVQAVDASAPALSVASGNAHRLGLAVVFVRSNWLAQVTGQFHLIVSNPPYVAEADPHLGALAHEPLSALTAGVDGLDDLRRITAQAPARITPGGWLLLEHGYNQAGHVSELLAQAGFAEVTSRRDLAGIPRCTGGRWPNAPQS